MCSLHNCISRRTSNSIISTDPRTKLEKESLYSKREIKMRLFCVILPITEAESYSCENMIEQSNCDTIEKSNQSRAANRSLQWTSQSNHRCYWYSSHHKRESKCKHHICDSTLARKVWSQWVCGDIDFRHLVAKLILQKWRSWNRKVGTVSNTPS